MRDVSGFIAFVEGYSSKNNERIEMNVSSHYNEDECIYISIYNFEDNENENYLFGCKVTDENYYFRDIGVWNLKIIEFMLACMRYENRGILPDGIYINGHAFSDSSYESVWDFLRIYPEDED